MCLKFEPLMGWIVGVKDAREAIKWAADAFTHYEVSLTLDSQMVPGEYNDELAQRIKRKCKHFCRVYGATIKKSKI